MSKLLLFIKCCAILALSSDTITNPAKDRAGNGTDGTHSKEGSTKNKDTVTIPRSREEKPLPVKGLQNLPNAFRKLHEHHDNIAKRMKKTDPKLAKIGYHQEPHPRKIYMINSSTALKQTRVSRHKHVQDRTRRSLPSPSNSTKLICHNETSCKNQCSKARKVVYKEHLSCYCDIDCEFFQDCCADYDEYCAIPLKNNSLQELIPDRSLWKCFQKNLTKITMKIWMIGSCPTTWPKDDIFYKCRNLSVTNKITKDNYRYLPVYTSNGTVYHNRFCAQCNGETLDQLKSYQLSMDCDATPPAHLHSLDEKLEFLFSYCRSITWKEMPGHPRRYCLPFNYSRCTNVSLLGKCLNGSTRVVGREISLYKNIHCAKCGMISWTKSFHLSRRIRSLHHLSRIECGPNAQFNDFHSDFGCPTCGPALLPKPLSIMFDMNTADEDDMDIATIKCPYNKVYDSHLEMCRRTLPLLPIVSDIEQYDIVYSLSPLPKCLYCILLADLQKQIAGFLKLSPMNITNPNLDWKASFLLVEFKIYIKDRQLLNPSENLKNTLNFTKPFNITIKTSEINETFLVVKVATRILSCWNLDKYSKDDIIVSKSAVVIKATGAVLQPNDYYTNGTSLNESQTIFVCQKRLPFFYSKIANCTGTWVLMEAGEFSLLHNQSVFVNASHRLYEASHYIWKNRSLYVCENFTNQGFIYTKPDNSSKNDYVLTIVTIVCMSMSIIALVFVLVTYSLFAELRTPPGINLMNLSVSILLAQLLWLLGSGQTDKPVTCTAIAVLLHYFFLVSFVWTSIIAFDTWRAFTAKGRRSMTDSKRKRLLDNLRNMTFGWLSVMVYVAICVALDLTNTVTIGYQSRKACWMTNPRAILYFVASPVAIILLANVVMYVLTMKAIHVTTAQARVATDRNHLKQFGVYVRIASAMGFTWILGFIAPFALGFLWYPFVILNGLQGMYLALSFGLNRRARNLYRKLIDMRISTSSRCDTTIQDQGIDETKL